MCVCVCVCANLVPRASLGPKSRVWSLASSLAYSCNVSRASALTCLISRLLRCSRSFSIACFGSHVHGFLHNSVSCVVVSM